MSATRRRLLLSLTLAACAGRRETATGTPTASSTAPADAADAKLFDDARVHSRVGGAAGSASAPVPRCGPKDSYRYVAEEFRCPGGGNPFAGDAGLAARARAGSVGPTAEGHMIDVYEVPCPSGKVDVFVDMYGCPEMQQQLARDSALQDPLDLEEHFVAGRYDEVRARCAALDDDSAALSVHHCGIFEPALALRVGDAEKAVAAAARTCRRYPPDGPRSSIRVEVAVAIVDAITRMWASDGVPIDENSGRVAALIPRLLSACAVGEERFLIFYRGKTAGD